MSALSKLLMALGLGAGAMYLYDPQQGNRRRAVLRDQLYGTWNDIDHGFGKATRDLRNRARGMSAEARAMLRNEQPDDRVLEERVRSSLGWSVMNSRAVQVSANEGHVTLTGPVLASDVDELLRRVSRVRGVRSVDSQLDVHEHADDIPALQGDPNARWRRWEDMRQTWTPSTRLLASLAGGTLLLTGMVRGGFMGTARGLVGAGLLARALANRPLGHLTGLGGDGNGNGHLGTIHVQKGINIHAPVEDVFRFWQNYQNFPRFMSNVEEVRDLGDGRSHWLVKGPAGLTAEWDAHVTDLVPNELIAWRSDPGSMVEQVGTVRFGSNPDGTTRVDVQLTYTPPAGAVGHAIASLLGANPKQQMDEDLARLKSLIEQGETTARGQKVRREDVGSSG